MKQRNIPWLGAVVDSLYTSLPILSVVNFFVMSTILYANIYPYLQTHLPWMRYWNFLIIVGAIAVVVIALVYKFVVPSVWSFRSKQMFSHESEVINKLDALTKKVDGLTERLDK